MKQSFQNKTNKMTLQLSQNHHIPLKMEIVRTSPSLEPQADAGIRGTLGMDKSEGRVTPQGQQSMA